MRLLFFVVLIWIGYEVSCIASPFGQTLNVDIAKKKGNNVGRSEGSERYCTIDDKRGRCVDISMCKKSSRRKPIFDYRSSGCTKNECCVPDDLNNKYENITTKEGESEDLQLRDELEPRTHGNDTAKYGEFPFVIALHSTPKGESVTRQSFIGVGTLIHQSVVLTVAHKVDNNRILRNPSQIKCRAGEWIITEEVELFLHQDRDVKKIVIHSDYDNVNIYYDAALLFVESPFSTTSKIGVACLGQNLPPPDTLCFTMGWGNSFTDLNSSALKKVQMSTIELARCQRQLRNTHLSDDYTLHYSFMCAVVPGVDPDIGDGGAPLVCSIEQAPNKPVVYGMVMYHASVADAPWVYARVPALAPWLTTELGREGKNATFC